MYMYMDDLFLRITIKAFFYQSFFVIYTSVLHYRLTDKTILKLISISKPFLPYFHRFFHEKEFSSRSSSGKDRRTSEQSLKLLPRKQQPTKRLHSVHRIFFTQNLFVKRRLRAERISSRSFSNVAVLPWFSFCV